MDFHNVDILLVEDDAHDAETTLLALNQKKRQNKIYWVRDGADALAYFACTGTYADRDPSHMPKLVLLDLKMPKVGGLDVLRELKANVRTRAIPVVVMTSSNEEGDVAESYQLGTNAYVVKPVDFEAFTEAVVHLGMFWLFVNTTP